MKIMRCFGCILVISAFYSCSHESQIHLPHGSDPGYLIINSSTCYFKNNADAIIGHKITIWYPSAKQREQINEITAYIGLPQNVLLVCSDIKGVIACVAQHKNIILFDKNMFSAADSASNYWQDYYMLSHAIGHHLSNDFYLESNNMDSAELDADRFAGASLYRLGADSAQTIKGLQQPDLSHFLGNNESLSLSRRMIILMQGYDDASNQYVYQLAIPPPPANGPNMALKLEFKIGDFADDTLELNHSNTYDSAKINYEGIISYAKVDSDLIDSSTILPPIPGIQIEITKSNNDKDAIGTAQRISLAFPELKYTSDQEKKDRKNYLSILRRGTKLKFRYYSYKGYNNVYYVKYLSR